MGMKEIILISSMIHIIIQLLAEIIEIDDMIVKNINRLENI